MLCVIFFLGMCCLQPVCPFQGVLKIPVRYLQSNAGFGNQDDGKQDIRKCLQRMYTRTTRNSYRQSVRQCKETKPKQSSSATACNCLSLQRLVASGSLKSTFCTDEPLRV